MLIRLAHTARTAGLPSGRPAVVRDQFVRRLGAAHGLAWYETACQVLQKLRITMVRPGRTRGRGRVCVNRISMHHTSQDPWCFISGARVFWGDFVIYGILV